MEGNIFDLSSCGKDVMNVTQWKVGVKLNGTSYLNSWWSRQPGCHGFKLASGGVLCRGVRSNSSFALKTRRGEALLHTKSVEAQRVPVGHYVEVWSESVVFAT